MLEALANSQDPLATSLTLTVNGPGGATISQQLPLASGKFGPTRMNGFLFPGFNTITVKFQDCRGAVQSGTPYFITPGELNPLGMHAHDFMSYGHLDALNSGAWVSPYTYANLFDTFWLDTNLTLTQSAGPVEKLVAIGQIGADGSVDLKPFHRVVTGFNSGSGALGEFSLELLDEQGRILVLHRFDAQAIPHDATGRKGFTEFAPWHASARRIVLKHNETTLVVRTVSPNAPTVRVLSPNGGESLGTEATILWEASDPDGDPFTYTVLYNNGADSTWWPIATGVTTTAIKVDASLWPGSSRGRVMVRVTDGVYTAEDVTETAFSIPQKSPLPRAGRQAR